MLVGKVKEKNLEAARKCIEEAASEGCKLVVLPECFNSPYGTNYFPEYAEEIKEGSVSVDMLCEAAKEFGVYIIGGILRVPIVHMWIPY
jgi:omega-amidase